MRVPVHKDVVRPTEGKFAAPAGHGSQYQTQRCRVLSRVRVHSVIYVTPMLRNIAHR